MENVGTTQGSDSNYISEIEQYDGVNRLENTDVLKVLGCKNGKKNGDYCALVSTCCIFTGCRAKHGAAICPYW